VTPETRIAIFYAWGTQNAGDHALALGALSLLTSLVPPHQIVVVSRYAAGESTQDATADLKRQFPGVRVVPCPFGSARSTRRQRLLQNAQGLALSLLCVTLPRLALRLFRHKDAIQELGRADLVLLMGGNLFYWHRYRKSLPRLGAFALPLLMAHRLGIPYGFLPQTSGPFEGRMGRLLGKLFERAAFVLFRDRASLENVAAIADLTRTQTEVGPDLAFFLRRHPQRPASALSQLGLTPGEYIAVTVRIAPLGDRGIAQEADDSAKVLSRLAALLPEVLAVAASQLGKRIVFVAQTDEDVEPSREVRQVLADRYHVASEFIDTRDVATLLDLYANALLLVGMRMHSLIFALSQGTPVVGLWRRQLGPKIPAMLSDLGLADYALELASTDVTNVTSAIVDVARNRKDLSERVLVHLERHMAMEREVLRDWISRCARQGDAPMLS
jgi:polysaccharide pyruvyl transferase WcaK-like protein